MGWWMVGVSGSKAVTRSAVALKERSLFLRRTFVAVLWHMEFLADPIYRMNILAGEKENPLSVILSVSEFLMV